MGIRFRRSMKLGKGLRLNLSKGGAGFSLGGKGMRMGLGPRGAYRSFGVPGTGLYAIDYMNQKSSKQSKNQTSSSSKQAQQEQADPLPMPKKIKTFNYPILCFVAMLVFIPINPFVSLVLLGLGLYGRKKLSESPQGKARIHFKDGKEALIKGDTAKALEKFSDLLDYVDLPQIYPLLAELNIKEGFPEKALEYLNDHVSNNPTDEGVKFLYGLTLKQMSRYDKAIEVFQEVLNKLSEDHPARVKVISELGDCFLKKDRPEMALEVLKSGPVRARKLDDDRMYFKYLLGLAYKENGEKGRALTHLQRVYAHNREFKDVKDLVAALEG